MAEPNRLRDTAPPNTFRTGVAQGAAGAPTAATRGRGLASPAGRSISSRAVFYGGLAVALLGVLAFFGPGVQFAEVGIGLICLGLGVSLTVVARRVIARDLDAARRSRLATIGMLVLAPHAFPYLLAGPALIAFGLFVLAMAFGII